MKFHTQFTLLFLLINVSVFAQRAKSASVSSAYLSVPTFNIETTNPSQLEATFAIGNTKFKKPEAFETEEVCVASGSKNVLKDAKKIKVYCYSIEAEIKDAFLVVKTPDGEVVHSEKLNNDFAKTGSLMDETTKLIYGQEECYWHKQVLEEAWEGDQEEWKKKHHEKIKSRYFQKAERTVQNAFKFGYKQYTVDVYTAKGGKGHDYSELNEAQKQAIAAYENIGKNGLNQQSIDQLMIPVNTWQRYTEQINMEDKRAKINRKVARGLYLNLAAASFIMRNFDDATKYLELIGGPGQDVTNISRLIAKQQEGLAANPSLSNDIVILNEKVKTMGSTDIKVTDIGESKSNELSGEHHFYKKDADKKADIAAHGGSIYKANIRPGQYGPTLTMMSVFDGDLEEFPIEATTLDVKGLVFSGGYSFKSIPPEIGNMTNLVQVDISGSAVESIPEEIGKLTSLKKLNLSRTNISSLPESIKNLKNLKLLNIKKTKISGSELAKIKSLLPKSCKVKA